MPRYQRILLVEDDPAWASVVTDALQTAGYGVVHTPSAVAARALVMAAPPDLVLLDLILPDGDGLVLCADLKDAADLPVLICSSTRRRFEPVLALKLGADAFVAKPCNLEELVARVDALLRARALPGAAALAASIAPRRDLEVDHGRRQARFGAAAVRLTPAEYRLLSALTQHPNEVVGRDHLAHAVYGGPEAGRALDMLVRRVRTKLDSLGTRAPRIDTIRRRGFALAVGS
ncbi:MAG TPA: response regulator transcription factor [Chloroflexota bacterium]|jgi:DNA-binding response OmpR family regulator|nr:response regulator transcription factor [Chloroflexota bacterium]